MPPSVYLPVCPAQLQSGRPPVHPGLSSGCCTRPLVCPFAGPAGLSRPPPPADFLIGLKAAVPAGCSAPRKPGHSPAPGGEQTQRVLDMDFLRAILCTVVIEYYIYSCEIVFHKTFACF